MTEEIMQQKKGVTGTTLKIIALIAMFIDHFAAILIEDYLTFATPGDLPQEQLQAWFADHRYVAVLEIVMLLMRLIGRFGFPLFAFLIVEGFQHTRSVKKYMINLGVFALISELPFNLGFSSKLFYPGYQNVFLTLFLGLGCLACMHYFIENKKNNAKFVPFFYFAAPVAGVFTAYVFIQTFWVISGFVDLNLTVKAIIGGVCAVLALIFFACLGLQWDVERKNEFTFTVFPIVFFCIIADLLITDYSAGGVLVIVTMYLLRRNRERAFGFGVLILTLMQPLEAAAFFMLIPISKYNGERGMKLNKYFYYAFYPVHIGLLYLVTLILGYTTFALR